MSSRDIAKIASEIGLKPEPNEIASKSGCKKIGSKSGPKKKRHANVLRDIEDEFLPEDFNRLIFESVYKDAKGEKRKHYLLTKDAVELLMMRYSREARRAVHTRWKELETHHAARLDTRTGWPELTHAIQQHYGNDRRAYINEADMLNRLVVGMSAQQYKRLKGLKDKANIRDYFSEAELALLSELQRYNRFLIDGGKSRPERKADLAEYVGRWPRL